MRPILLQGHTRPLTQLKYNKEGDLLFSVAKDNVVNVWYSVNGERLGTYDGHEGSIWTLDTSKDSKYLLTGSADNSVILFEVSNGKILSKLVLETAIKRIEFSQNDTRFLALVERRMGFPGGIKIFDFDVSKPKLNEKPILVIEPELKVEPKITIAGWSFCDSYVIAGHEDGSISSYDPKNGSKLFSIKPHEEIITDIQFNLDRTYFITTSKDKTAKIISCLDLEILKNFVTDTPLNSGVITPLKDFVILGGGQEAGSVTTTSAREGKFESIFWHLVYELELGRLKGHFGPINTLAIDPNGKCFASGGEDGLIRLQHFDSSYFDFDIE